MASNFINDKTAEIIAAVQSGDNEKLTQAVNEAVKENDASVEQTLAAMTQAANQQRGR